MPSVTPQDCMHFNDVKHKILQYELISSRVLIPAYTNIFTIHTITVVKTDTASISEHHKVKLT